MKIQVTFKTPDVLSEVDTTDWARRDKVVFDALVQKYIECDEYITVEFDTEAGTCVVVPA